MQIKWLIRFLTLIICLVAPSSLRAQYSYEIYPVSPVNYGSARWEDPLIVRGMYGVSTVGHCRVSPAYTGPFHAFLDTYDNRLGFMTTTDLGTLGGANSSAAAASDSAIGGYVVVTGYAENGAGSPRAFRYRNGVMTDLGTLGGSSSAGYAVNRSDRVAGYATLAGAEEKRAFLDDGSSMLNLGVLSGGRESVAYG